MIDAEHFRYREYSAPPQPSFRLPAEATVCFEVPKTTLIERAGRNFRTFLKGCFNISLREVTEAPDVIFRLRGEGAEESFSFDVTSAGIVVEAPHERGLLHATHYVERLMVDCGGAVLPLGIQAHEPAMSLRFTEGIFIPGMQSPQNPGDFSDEYLGLMSHFGANALKIYVNLFHLWRSKSLPELNSPDFLQATEALRRHAQRLAGFGIDLYLHLNTGPLAADHPVFIFHPETRGSRVEIGMEELSGRNWYALCSSSPKVLAAYQEAIGAVFSAAPELAGAVVIIGGECFFHCFTRPADSPSGETNCPHCQGNDAHRDVARLVNALQESLPTRKKLLAWPYSAFIWSADDATQSRWIHRLNSGVEVLSNFDCFDEDVLCGAGVRYFDYNIKLIGPSSVFSAQRDACRQRGLKIHAKTETTTTPDAFFLPYLPLHFRWYERFKAVRESGASGFMGQWRFFGMNGSIPEELQYHSVWNPERTADDLLFTIARRDFGLCETNAREAVEAWRMLSASWDDFPYSAMTSGEREGYMRGPWYLGPAHPLIFCPQSRYNLCEKFFQLRGDLAELTTEEERAAMPGKPRYIDDLWICLPFGVDAYLRFTRSCLGKWDAGLMRLKRAIGDSCSERARMELDVCEMVGIHLQTLANTVEFMRLRDGVAREPLAKDALEEIWGELLTVTDREIANASRALPILERDPRIGFGFTYGEVYDREMIEDKLRQCRWVRDSELPRLRSFIRFHVWQT